MQSSRDKQAHNLTRDCNITCVIVSLFVCVGAAALAVDREFGFVMLVLLAVTVLSDRE